MTSSNIEPCMIPELELFSKKNVQTCITGCYVDKIKPLNSVESHVDELEFVTSGRALSYCDVNNMVLRVVIYFRKKCDKSNLEAGDVDTSVIDFPLHSIFSKVELFLAETSVIKSPHNYPYKVFFDLATTACKDAVATQLQSILCYPDDRPDSAAHCTSWGKRQAPLLRSQKCELVGRLRTDFNNIEPHLYLLDNISIRLRLTMHSPDFYLWTKSDAAGGPDVELCIQDAELHLKYFNISTDLSLGIERMLAQQNARYYFKSTQIKTFIHPALTEIISIPVCQTGRLPSLIILSIVRSADYAGNIKTNPFYFPAEGVSELSFFCNGVERRFQCNMSDAQGCTSVFRSLYDQTGHYSEEASGNMYTIQSLKSGHFACAVDFTPDQSGAGPSQNLDSSGSIRIQGKLKAALDHSLLILVYAEFPSCVEISAAREVFLL